MIGIPNAVAFALRDDGWYLRAVCPWVKGNAFCEPPRDRPTIKIEYLFQLTKSNKTYYDNDAVFLPKKTHENRKNGIVRDREKDYDSKFAEMTGRKQSVEKPESETSKLYRSRRSTDWFYESLDRVIEQQKEYLEHLEYIKNNGGLLLDQDGEPLAFNVNTKPNKIKHYASFCSDLISPCILASCPENGVVIDPFMGSGSTAIACKNLGRNYIGFDSSKDYCIMSEERLENV